MARSHLIIGSVCLLLSGMSMARQQGHVRTGISAKGTSTANAPATSSPGVKPATVMNSGRPGQVATAPIQAAPANMQPQQQVGPPAPESVQQPPQRPEQMPPVPARVSYQNGLLTVQAPTQLWATFSMGFAAAPESRSRVDKVLVTASLSQSPRHLPMRCSG